APAECALAFRRTGVFREVESLASRMSAAKSKEDVKKDESTPEPTATPPPMATTFTTSTPGYKKLASLALEPKDAITLQARVCPPGDSRYTTSDAKVFFNPASAQRHQGTFLEVFGRKAKPMHIQTLFSVFVKKLQGSLTQMEPCRVVTIAQGVDALTGSPSFASSCRAQPPAESDSRGRWILGMWTRVIYLQWLR
ncbi:hypothetical protein BDM02DRAFT_3133469, partial [Thelephora ganbajun]